VNSSADDRAQDQRVNPNRMDAFRRVLDPILAEVEADDRGFLPGTQVPLAAVPRLAQKVRELSASGQKRGRWLNRFLTEKVKSDEELMDGISLRKLRKLVITAETPNVDFQAIKRAKAERAKQDLASGNAVDTKLISGSQFGRLAGLEPLSVICPGRSVLDVGCHRGLISYEAARCGATLVHGVDLYPQGIEAAQEIFQDSGIPNQFAQFDLSLGREAILDSLGDMLQPSYDVVLLLAVMQHLRRQMDSEGADALLDFFAELAGTYVVLRMPNVEACEGQLSRHGFRKVYFNHIDQKLSPVGIYERG
jgi:hypothetical protein